MHKTFGVKTNKMKIIAKINPRPVLHSYQTDAYAKPLWNKSGENNI